jgi:hypothetical protein
MSDRHQQKMKRRFSSQHESSHSWDESSDPESFDSVQQRVVSSPRNNNIVVSNLTGNIMGDSVVVNIEDDSEQSTTSNESNSDEEEMVGGDAEGDGEEEEEEDELHHNDWEVRMLAAELKKRESVSELARAESSENDGLLRRRKRRSDTDTDASENENVARTSRPRAASLDQHNLRKQQYKCKSFFKALSFDRDKDQL